MSVLLSLLLKLTISCRATKDILRHQEVFVDYGPEYAVELGIDQSTYDTYTRPENHTTVAIPCSSCDTSFSSQHFFDIHKPRCGKMSNPSTPAVGINQLGFKQCPAAGGVPCQDLSCGKVFNKKDHMTSHYRTVHLGEKKFPCVDCGKAFTSHWDMQRHHRTVHLKEKPFFLMWS